MPPFLSEPEAVQKLAFDTLPWDVILHILDFVPPLDIIALRRTCKLFCVATQQHVVWIHALRSVCYENNLYADIFAPEDLPRAHIELAATTPSRFIRRVKDASTNSDAMDGTPTSPVPTPVLEGGDLSRPQETAPRKDLPYLAPLSVRSLSIPPAAQAPLWHLTDAVNELRLAPGGRYLAMNHYWDMQIWDLGLHATDEPRLIATHTFPNSGDFVIYGIWIKPDGRGLQIQTNFLCTEPPRNELAIWEIYPLESDPQLRPVASMMRGPMLTYECRGGSRIAISEENTVGVWDPTLNTLITWAVPADMVTMLIIQTRAICLYKDRITVYEVPYIIPRSDGALQEELHELSPIWTTLLPYSVDDYFLPASWPYSADRGMPRSDLYFGLTEAVPARNYIYRVPARPLPVADAPAIELVAVVDVEGPVPPRLDNFLQRPVRMCEGHLALMSEPSTREEVRLQIVQEPRRGRNPLDALSAAVREDSDMLPGRMPGMWPPAGAAAGTSSDPIVLDDEVDSALRTPTWSVSLYKGDGDVIDFEFDGASGRACAITDEYEVLVLDYLQTPGYP
ncbi:hypothetical protein GGF50DRAFT_66838 [Schizophyllum commune]